ncbi:MAG: extracellular solute-binding protein [Defluviitaleaceae bacterium]|nr:extracellular solute-binding protein [Defluviitaleaceae bacterium]
MKKLFIKALLLTAVLAAALLVQACGNGDDEQAAGGGNSIILYSNAITDGRGDWIQERAREELGIEIDFVDMGGVGLANRLIEERYNPIGDVVFGLNQLLWANLINNDVLEPYTPSWASEVPAHLNHRDGYFHAVALMANLLIYDTEQFSPAEAPTDWLELWNEERFHGRHAFSQALTGSTTHMILSGIFTRFMDPNGTLGISDEGWANIQGKYSTGVNLLGEDLFATIALPDNDVAMGQMWHTGKPVRAIQHNVASAFVEPAIGVPFSVEGVGLIRGANNPEAAQRFIDWFGSAETMQAFGIEFNYLPANPNALDGLPEDILVIANLRHQAIDWDYIAPRMDSWLEHIYLTYMQ